MYGDFFGLARAPFNITPDPSVLYLNDCYQEAIAALAYGIEARKGFVALVGEAGTGKTTLLRRLLETLDRNVRTVLLLHPTVSFDEILEHILRELGLPTDGGRKLVFLQRLHEFLLEHTRAGGNVALLIDEAQDLAPGVLEELRLLSNLETGREKILQIVLAGQPELDAKLADPGLRQLRQRIAMHVRIRPLSPPEVEAYVRTRLEAAGARDTRIFTPEAVALIARISDGIPRIVNVLCDACLMGAFASGQARVAPALVEEAWTDFAHSAAPPAPAPAPPPPEVAPPLPAVVPAPPTLSPVLPVVRTISFPAAIALVALGVAIAAVLLVAGEHRPDTPGARVVASPPPTVAPVPAGPPSAAEAMALVEEYRATYEARDVEHLQALFAPDATDAGIHGADAIADRYRQAFADMTELHYALTEVHVEPGPDATVVRAGFALRYRTAADAGDARGDAEWTLTRRDGRARIASLTYRFTPAR
jgi:general secretion pathway protein A